LKESIATDIETKVFYSIVKHLKNDCWRLEAEYNEFDKAIDFDLYFFTKEHETCILGWTNWFEGEIKASDKTFAEIGKALGINFKFGNPNNIEDADFLDRMKILIKQKT